MNIVFYGLWPELEQYTKTKMGKVKATIVLDKITDKNAPAKAEILATFIESPVDKKVLAKMPKLKLIATMSTGYDHIDLAECKKRNIAVCNVPSYGENTVAEHALALMLALSRKLFTSVKRVKEGSYDYHGLRGVDLKGKTLGVVGTGRIGQHLIRMARALEMKVIGYDKFPNKKMADEMGFTYTTLPKLLATSDFISLHTPLFKETFHLINQKNINKIKKGAFIINTARGALIEAEALVLALQSKRIAGAGLDVLEEENLMQDEEQIMAHGRTQTEIRVSLMNNILIDHPNVIVTPHNAFNSTEALQRIVDTTVENIKSYIKGEPVNVIK